jgi:cell division protein FtsQ
MAGGGYVLLHWEPEQLPVRIVTVDGEVQRLSRALLHETVVGRLDGGILTQDLAKLKEAVEALPWVRSASLRRHWPDRLELKVVEHRPVARWGSDGLVTADGVVFRPEDGAFPPGLALLAGVDERAPEVVGQFLAFAPRFAQAGLELEQLTLNARGAWALHSAGLTLELGKTRVTERVDRFLRVYPRLAAAGTPAAVDMRYSNGLSVRWANDGDAPAADVDSLRAGNKAQARGLASNRS